MEAAGRPTRKRARGALIELFGRAGLAMESFWRVRALLGFMGFTLEALGQACFARALADHLVVAQIETPGLNAVPIICLLNFLVGAVITFLAQRCWQIRRHHLYRQPRDFRFLRELAVLLTAILIAVSTAAHLPPNLGR